MPGRVKASWERHYMKTIGFAATAAGARPASPDHVRCRFVIDMASLQPLSQEH